MKNKNEDAFLERFKKMFNSDTARIVHPCGMMFLIIGFYRNTQDDQGQWYCNGQSLDFDYVSEKVIASGENYDELLSSVMKYKSLLDMSVM